jgi:periplasmic protein TonB
VATIDRPDRANLGLAISIALHATFLIAMAATQTASFSEAVPLPMIDIALEAANAGMLAETIPLEPQITSPQPKAAQPKKPKPRPIKPKAEPALKKPRPQAEDDASEPESQPQTNASPIDVNSKLPPTVGTHADSTSQRSQTSSSSAANAFANYLNNPKPHYPGVARNRHWEGLVYLRVYVTTDGLCGNLSLQRSSGHGVLDEAAMAAVRNWKFAPGTRGGMAVASWVTVPIEFDLRD